MSKRDQGADGGPASHELKRFHLDVPESEIEDLKRRLDRARWPEKEPVTDWSQGIPLSFMRDICRYWRHDYDWRRCEAELNRLGQFVIKIDGLDIHLLHIRSRNPDALPLLLTHGWPSSVTEYLKVIEPLINPPANGGDMTDAFHLIIPSLPGYGFSEKPSAPGWTVQRIARCWAALMAALGYDHFVAQGGDWGSIITAEMGVQMVAGCRAIHLSMPIAFPEPCQALEPTSGEKASLSALAAHMDMGSGYSKIQSTRPQTLGYGLVDSPVGQAGWILEKFWAWSDCNGDPLSVFTIDELLDNVMIYWLSATAASSARLYWESATTEDIAASRPAKIGRGMPVGCSIFPKDIIRPSRRWAEGRFENLIYWNELEKGGHFAAAEQPALFVNELRHCFRTMRNK